MVKYIAFIFVVALAVPLTAFAVNLYSGETVNITEPEEGNIYGAGQEIKTTTSVNGDAVLAGSSVSVEEIQGNALLAGAEVEIKNTVAGDVAVVGAEVTVNGVIEGDLRAAGGGVTITEDVQGDVLAAGSVVEIQEGVTIGGDVITYGSQIIVNGVTEGDLEARGQSIEMNGEVQGKSYIQGSQLTFNGSFADLITVSSNPITVGDEAEFQDVFYWTPEEQEFGQTSSLSYDTTLESHLDTGDMDFGFEQGFGLVFGALSAGVFIVVLMLLFNPFWRDSSAQISSLQDVGRSALLGILLLVGTLALVIILGISIIGIPLAIFILILWATLMFLISESLTSLMISYWINNHFNLELPYIAIFGGALAIYLVLAILTILVPWLGGLLFILFGIISWGTVLYHIYHMRSSVETEH